MKNYFKTAIILLSLLFLTACPSQEDSFNVSVINNSDHNISIYVGVMSREYGGSLYPDTLLPAVKTGKEIPKNSTTWGYTYGYTRNYKDTLCFFLWDTDTANIVPWERMVSENKILQRYDLTLSDVESLCTGK